MHSLSPDEPRTQGERAAPYEKRLYKWGSISALLLGIGYLIIFILYARVGAPPSGSGAGWFRYLTGKTTVWWGILALSVFTDLLYVPIALALYALLNRANRAAMLLATTFMGLFVVLDLAVTWSHYASILTLFAEYSEATNDVQRGGYIGAANYGAAMLASPLEIVYAIVTLSIGILITGIVMLRGRFDRTSAYLAIATGILGVAALSGFGPMIVGNALFATIWLFAVSFRLYRLAA